MRVTLTPTGEAEKNGQAGLSSSSVGKFRSAEVGKGTGQQTQSTEKMAGKIDLLRPVKAEGNERR